MSRKNRPRALDLIIASQTAKPVRVSPPPREIAIEPPTRLSEGRQDIWREVVRTIEVRACDEFILETLVGLMDQQRALQRLVDKGGPILIQANGKPQHNPAATALRQIEPQLTRLFKELGMSPATRARLKLDNCMRQSGSDSRWADF